MLKSISEPESIPIGFREPTERRKLDKASSSVSIGLGKCSLDDFIAGLSAAFERVSMRIHVASALAMIAIMTAGCSSQSLAPTSNHDVPVGGVSHRAPTALRITIPKRTHRTGGLGKKYVSPATQSISISVNSGVPQVINITTGSTGCSTPTILSPLTCTVQLNPDPPLGLDYFTIDTYDGLKATGHVLSAATEFPYEVQLAKANFVNVTLGGYPSTVQIAPLPNSPYMLGSTAAGYSIYGTAVQQFSVIPYDADNNAIIGIGGPTITVTPSTSAVSVSRPSASNPNVWQLTANTFNTSASLAVTATSTDLGGSTVTKNVPIQTKHRVLYVVDATLSTLNEYNDGSTTPVVNTSLGNVPGGIALDGNGTIAITYPTAAMVTLYTANGTPAYNLGPTGGFESTSGVCFDHEGDLYVVSGNASAHAVYEYQSGSTNLYAVYADDLTLPFACAIGSDDSLWVTDETEREVVHFPAGNTTHDLSYPVETGGIAATPYGIAVARNGDVLVGAALSSSDLVILDYASGSVSGSAPSFFTFSGATATTANPFGLAVDAGGTTYLAADAVTGYAGYFPAPFTSASGAAFVKPAFGSLSNPSGVTALPRL